MRVAQRAIVGHLGRGHVVYLYAIEKVTAAAYAIGRRYILIRANGGENPTRLDSRL
jgi:hypothetical protein